ncbi:DivIVA domain-containing protein [Micromonospora rifamycinica]|uniref:DivIVA domain-containing protein n=1 Tax=Micromonospora rifamycinica TaxID=291594 RepID=UPI0033F477BE
MNARSGAIDWSAGRPARETTPLAPEQVRRLRFRRSGIGQRGLSEEHVYAFLRRVVDELTSRDTVEAGLREENTRLMNALKAFSGPAAHLLPPAGRPPPRSDSR